MKFNIYQFLFLFSFLPAITTAQSVVLKGQIMNSSSSSVVEAANILLLDSKGALVKGEFVLDGQFELEIPSHGDYQLLITALGFEDHSQLISIEDNQKNIQLQDIYMLPIGVNIETVEVVGLRKPMFEQRNGNIIVNVGESALAAGSTVQELLAKTPRVQASEEGGISVFGKGNAIVFIDGRRALPTELTALPAEDIEKIEVIPNPSSKYEASGQAVINIYSKRNKKKGSFLDFRSTQRQGLYIRTNNNVQFSFRNDRLSMEASYWFHPYRKLFTDEYIRQDATTTLTQRIDRIRNQHSLHTYQFALDYSLNEKSGISFQYRGNSSGRRENTSNLNTISGSLDLSSLQNTSFSNDNNRRNSYLSNYWIELGSNGNKLELSVDHTEYTGNKIETFQEVFSYSTNEQRQQTRLSDNSSDVIINTVQLNLALPYSNDRGALEVGLRGVDISSGSNLLFKDKIGSEMLVNPRFSNAYQYRESVGAAYADWKQSFGKIEATAGLRGELTKALGESNSLQQTVVDASYINFFPSASIGYTISDLWKLDIKYGKRIERPSFQDLDPFLFYIDSLSYFQGNPTLQPAISHNLDGSITFMDYASFNVGFQKINNAIQRFVESVPGQEGAARLSMQNFDYVETFFVGLTLPYQTKRWTTVNNFGIRWNEVSLTNADAQYQFSKPLWYAAFYNALKVAKGYSIEATIQYNSSGQEGVFTFQPNLVTNLAIRKKFFDNKLSVTLSVNDWFNIDRQRTNLQLDGLNIETTSFYDARWVQIAANYQIGTSHSSKQPKSINNDDKNRLN